MTQLDVQLTSRTSASIENSRMLGQLLSLHQEDLERRGGTFGTRIEGRLDPETAVDGRIPAPLGMYKTW